ncbi:MAG TPA: hypothetical protein ENN40_02310 [Candidatus Aminicenantes bacterium]|nr:hypothetical protein [Candidatus Aminicenantes bacterium]
MTENTEQQTPAESENSLGEIIEKLQADRWTWSNFYRRPKFWIAAIMVVLAFLLGRELVRHQQESISSTELGRSLELVSTETRWVNKEVTPYRVKIVPSVTFTVHNKGNRSIGNLKFVGIFMFADSGEQMSDGVTPLMPGAVEPGETTDKITINALYGYSATSKAAFLHNKDKWKPIKVRILAQTSAGFAPLGVVPVRQVIEGIEGDINEEEAGEMDERMQKALKLGESLQVLDAESRWEDKVVTRNQAVIVPVIRFRLKNTGDAPLHNLILKGVFEFEEDGRQLTVGEAEALTEPLGPGKVSDEIALKGEFGYSASSKAAFVHNRADWKPVKVRVLARSRQSGDALLGIFPISREIEGVKVKYRSSGG